LIFQNKQCIRNGKECIGVMIDDAKNSFQNNFKPTHAITAQTCNKWNLLQHAKLCIRPSLLQCLGAIIQ